jgi:hypothetical protein
METRRNIAIYTPDARQLSQSKQQYEQPIAESITLAKMEE